MGNRVEDFIALVTLLVVVVLVGTVGRLWILRHRPRTFAVNLSDCAFLLFSVLMMGAAGMAYDGVDKELKIQRAYGVEGIEKRLLTPKYLKEFFVISLFCTTQVWLLKAAFLGYYWSLRETLSGKVRLLLYVVSVYAAVTYMGVISLQLGYCRPMSRNWSTGSDQCISVQTVPGMVAQQGTNISSDILILLIPLLTIGSFRSSYGLTRKDLYALAFVFGVGIVSIIASVVRFTQVYNVVVHSDSSLLAIRQTIVWALVEKLFAFTAFCLPCLRVFYRKRHSAAYMDKESSGSQVTSISSKWSRSGSEL
ncbi:uncharacterized protein H6S33_005595 [Morchella sextelata]|uniref:uncharacterized protein n=1 Tax=Morchella sextelata TaxID=1174677 RepID=UPI001D0392BF|nr:uncharacterized protein H6S33_005595 [Morchella sextelata]KAH0613709.1 hypothetical protein H6S33_005595 [Morchella sextelata]